MLRKLSLAVAFIAFISVGYAQVGQGALKGKVIDQANGEPLPFANLVLESAGGIQAGGATSDFDGKFTIKPVAPGKYTLKATFVGYGSIQVNDVSINGDKTTYLDVKMSEGVKIGDGEGFEIIAYTKPLIDKGKPGSGQDLDREAIERLPVRNIGQITSLTAGTNGTSIRGARGNASQTFIDGIKVRGSTSLPRAAIGEVNVITSGVPAQYGDLTGGVRSITTRGPSASSFGQVELLSSGFKKNDQDEVFGLDNQGYNLVGLTYGGPLLFKRDEEGKKEKPLIGLLVASEYITIVDPRPSIIGNYQAKEDVIDQLEQDPLRPTGTGTGSIQNSLFLRSDDLKIIDTRRNVGREDINLSANIDFNTTETTTLKFGGTFTYSDANFDINNNNPGQAFSLLNFDNNANQKSTTWRAFGRFTQRFNEVKGDEEESDASVIKNAFVSFQVDYERTNTTTQNANHEDRLFDYGYVGKFTVTRSGAEDPNNYVPRVDTVNGEEISAYFFEGESIQQIDFEPGTVNPILANYTKDYYSIYRDADGNLIYPGNYDRFEDIQSGGGLLNGNGPRTVYDLWTDVGEQYNNYALSNRSQFRITASGSADIKNHAISMGFEYQQTNDRRFSVNPSRLWTVGRQLLNSHLGNLDVANPIVSNRFGSDRRTVFYNRLYDGASQSTFDKNVRETLGLPVDGIDFVDIDSYDPGTYDLDFFSADELLNEGSPLVSYAGYDHKGDKLTGNRPSIDDFFNKRDENGNFTREIPSFQPIYVAGYIQDVFEFDDLIFRLGLRVDRFDANQPVLKDPFSLFPTVKAGNSITGGNHPSNIGDDFVVYTSDRREPSADNIIGYRDPNGDDPDIWYDASGKEVTNPTEELQGPEGIVTPWLVDPSDNSAEDDLTSASFEDYTPQITVMPRVSFSFPISEEANFYATYDVLTQSPATSLQMDPIDYLFLGSRNQVFNNPNLRPVKTISYELGFEQTLTKRSALSYSTYYREVRDEIQVVRKLGAYPVPYRTFENIDFGTTKGFSVEYDLRSFKSNIRILANYTLQFAEGTGSSTTSQLNLVNSNTPNLRTIQPLNVDRRHVINFTPQYRYRSGKEYNGPVWGGKDVFENAGISLIMAATSGQPYSKSSVITSGGLFSGGQSRQIEGGLNGSRLPWAFNIDLRADKDFPVKLSRAEKSNQKRGVLNVYVQIRNLLNTQNIIRVYDGTGSADDDGFLSEATSQPIIDNQNDPQSFRDLYTAKIFAPGFYAAQRIFRVGLQLSF